MTADWHHHVAALGTVPTGGRVQAAQIALPTDLFMVTAHFGADGSGCVGAGADDGAAPLLDLAVTLLRTHPQTFFSKAPGELAFALLTPAGLLALLGAPLHGATDRRLPLAQFCGAAELRTLSDALSRAGCRAERSLRFARWIEQRIHERRRTNAPLRRVAHAASLIQAQDGPLRLESVRADLHVSPRQLERDFRLWLGLSPAAYQRVVRFQRAAMSIADGEPLGQAAAGHAFADQSHLNRAFRRMSSLTPREFSRCAATQPAGAARRAVAGRVVLLEPLAA
jgi:AraC-like DNA-binding protein